MLRCRHVVEASEPRLWRSLGVLADRGREPHLLLMKPLDRRQFTKIAGAGAAAMALAWQQACAQVSDTGEVSAETVRTLLDAQGARGIYDDPEEFERLRRAVANSAGIANELRAFPLDADEQPLTIFRRG